jgi:predicted ATPase
LLPKLKRILVDLPPPLELAPQQARRHLFNCVCDFLARIARKQPALMILDDLHWADESSLSPLDHLSSRLATLPLLVVGSYRDIESNVTEALAKTLENFVRSRVASRIRLRGLTLDGVALMLGSLCGQEPPVPLVKKIFGETGGNPFFYRGIVPPSRR